MLWKKCLILSRRGVVKPLPFFNVTKFHFESKRMFTTEVATAEQSEQVEQVDNAELRPTQATIEHLMNKYVFAKKPRTPQEQEIVKYVRKLQKCGIQRNSAKVMAILDDLRIMEKPIDYKIYVAGIRALVRAGRIDHAHKVIDKMRNDPNVKVGRGILQYMINACKFSNDSQQAQKYMDEIIEKGKVPTLTAYTCLIDVYSSTNDEIGALKTFENMKNQGLNPDSIAYGAVLKLYAKRKDYLKAREWVRKMGEEGVEINRSTYNMLIQACPMPDYKDEAIRLFDEMKEKDILRDTTTYQTIMHKMLQAEDHQKVFEYYEMMKAARVKPTTFCYFILMKACKLDGFNAKRARKYWDEMSRIVVKPNEKVLIEFQAVIDGKKELRAKLRERRREIRKQMKQQKRAALENLQQSVSQQISQ